MDRLRYRKQESCLLLSVICIDTHVSRLARICVLSLHKYVENSILVLTRVGAALPEGLSPSRGVALFGVIVPPRRNTMQLFITRNV